MTRAANSHGALSVVGDVTLVKLWPLAAATNAWRLFLSRSLLARKMKISSDIALVSDSDVSSARRWTHSWIQT